MFHFVFDSFYFFFFFLLLLCFHRFVYHNKKTNRLSSIYYLHVFVFMIFASRINDSSTPCARNAVLYAVFWCKPVVSVWMLIDFRWMMVQNSVSVWCLAYVCIIYNRNNHTVNNSLHLSFLSFQLIHHHHRSFTDLLAKLSFSYVSRGGRDNSSSSGVGCTACFNVPKTVR